MEKDHIKSRTERIGQFMVPFFGNKLYARIREHNLDSWSSTSKFPGDVLLKTIEIAQSVYEKTTDRIGASAAILNLANAMDDKINKRVLVSASQLFQSLPFDPTNTDISEATLLNFTATELAEKYKRPPNFNGCPDCIIACYPHQTDDGINIGYGEVKKVSMAGNHYLVNWDLVRLAFFGKNVIDDYHLDGNISIHIVVPFIVFYLIKLQSDGLYTMTELLRVQFPMSVLEMPAYLTCLLRLKKVIHISETYCKQKAIIILTTPPGVVNP